MTYPHWDDLAPSDQAQSEPLRIPRYAEDVTPPAERVIKRATPEKRRRVKNNSRRYPDYDAINAELAYGAYLKVSNQRTELLVVCEMLHALLDEGCTLRAETEHQGRTILAWLYDAMVAAGAEEGEWSEP